MLCKNCTICKNFKHTETVFDGYIEHKTEKGEVWMLEPKSKVVPRHCPLNQKAYEEWSEAVKDKTYDEYKNINCNCDLFDPFETQVQLDKMLECTRQLLDIVKAK